MSLLNSLTSAASGLFATPATSAAFRPVTGLAALKAQDRELYQLLRDLYDGSDPWRLLANDPAFASNGLTSIPLRGLRNPAMAIVDFYTSVVMPGALKDALPIVPDDGVDPQKLQAAADQLWAWSNWATRKQLYVRESGKLGEVYLKASTKPDDTFPPERVYLEIVLPDYINCADTERDERGFVTRLRVDLPERADTYTGGVAPIVWHTELWDKDTQEARYWTKQSSPCLQSVKELGEPDRIVPFAEMGVDFVPWVWAPFLDMGEERGVSPVLLALEKMRELDQSATRLHQAFYIHGGPDMFIEGDTVGPDGAVSSAPRISQTATLEIAGRNVYSFPPGWRGRHETPNVPYTEWLQSIDDHWNAFRETTAPELFYWATADSNTTESGRALQTRMKGAISRATEARGNLEASLIRAMQMAFSIGKANGLKPFTELGEFDAGGMDFTFMERDVIPQTEDDRLEVLLQRATALKTLVDAGASIQGAAMLCGMSEDEATMLAGADLGVVVQ